MNDSRIVTVLDYFSGEVEVFEVFVDENCEVDVDEQVRRCIEERGHYLDNCYYMFSESNNFKLKMDI